MLLFILFGAAAEKAVLCIMRHSAYQLILPDARVTDCRPNALGWLPYACFIIATSESLTAVEAHRASHLMRAHHCGYIVGVLYSGHFAWCDFPPRRVQVHSIAGRRGKVVSRMQSSTLAFSMDVSSRCLIIRWQCQHSDVGALCSTSIFLYPLHTHSFSA